MDFEHERLKCLHDLEILDSGPEESFDRITRLASKLLNTPIAIISLVDENRQWFKSRIGLEPQETSRDVAFCHHTIQSSSPLAVEDTLMDARFANNPLVTGSPNIRAYLGVPLHVAGAWNVGTLCVIDQKPRKFTSDETSILVDLASLVVDLLEQRFVSNSYSEAETRFRDITNKVPDAIFRYVIHPDGSDSIEFLNEACVDLWEYTMAQLNDDPTPIWALTHDEDLAGMQASVQTSAEELSLWSHRWRIITPTGVCKWLHGRGTPRPLRDGSISWYTVITDVSESVLREEELQSTVKALKRSKRAAQHNALHDSLTGLPNRRCLDEKLARRVATSEAKSSIYVLQVDIDHFKEINDTLGHGAGDEALCKTATKLRNCTRKDDLVFRVGGDEFVILCGAGTTQFQANTIAARILEKTRQVVEVEDKSCRLTVSVGIAAAKAADVGSLLTDADIALYHAKRTGRNRRIHFNASMREQLVSRKMLADDIVRGLEADEFIPVYQPQFDAKTEDCVGLEALARWQHPEHGILPPSEFLDVATQIGLDREIDRMIFRKSMSDAEHWQQNGTSIPKVSVNVSFRRLLEPTLVEDLVRHKPEGVRLAIELLETVHFDDERNGVFDVVEKLRDADIEVEIDDFGTGHASITALERIKPHRLKIDRQLIAPIGKSQRSFDLVRSIAQIGRCMDIGVTAEGVETLEQLNALKRIGADVVQGYYFARPMMQAELTEFLMERASNIERVA